MSEPMAVTACSTTGTHYKITEAPNTILVIEVWQENPWPAFFTMEKQCHFTPLGRGLRHLRIFTPISGKVRFAGWHDSGRFYRLAVGDDVFWFRTISSCYGLSKITDAEVPDEIRQAVKED